MRLFFTLAICLAVLGRSLQEEDAYLRIPKEFTVGAGGSAYQIEGGWNEDGKGEGIWDRFSHDRPWNISENSNGDIACDAYHKYKDDVQWVKKMGLDHYRFSISWPRILPNGFADTINEEGLRYYHNLIDELLANDIEPSVLLYHWDHPQALEDMGGWTNESMIEWFTDYANIIFRELGPKVKIFTTINEPKVFCFLSYVDGEHAPGKTMNKSAGYICGHNVLKAHAKAYHLYDRLYRPTQNGTIGIVSVCASYYPKTPDVTEAAELAHQFDCGWISHPIFIGDYPEIVKNKLAEISAAAGFSKSILPEFSSEWIQYIRGTSDYFGLNHYTSVVVEFGALTSLDRSNRFLEGLGVSTSYDPRWESRGRNNWLRIVPEGFGNLLRKIKNDYNNPLVYIMENGLTDTGTLNDYDRIRYHYLYLKELLLAVHRDGCNVQKYTFWSLMDNFEWTSGYDQELFGLIHVNFSSPNRERVPKLSASWVQDVMRNRKLQPPILPPTNSTVVTVSNVDNE